MPGPARGEFALGMAAVQLTGEDHLLGLEPAALGPGGRGRLPAPVLAATTAATLAARFGRAQREGLERASAEVTARALAMLPVAERTRMLSGPVTIDLDAMGIEVFSTLAPLAHRRQGPTCSNTCRRVPTRSTRCGCEARCSPAT